MKNIIFVLVLLVVGACEEPRDHTGIYTGQPDASPCGWCQADAGCPPCPSCPDAGLPTDAEQAPDSGITDPLCWSDEDCDDGDECTLDECVGPPAHSGRCQYTQLPDCPPPDAGLPIDAGDVTPDAGCQPPPNGCDDGNLCNGVETWDPLSCTCLPGQPPNCDDQDSCTEDWCNPDDGQCVHEDLVCDDDAPICLDGQCVECITDQDCPPGESNLKCGWRCEDNVCVYHNG